MGMRLESEEKRCEHANLAGVENDHECSTAEEVLDKLRAGLHIYVREEVVQKEFRDTDQSNVRCEVYA